MKTLVNRPVVLIVEDEPLILMMTMDIVDDEGYRSLPAPSAEEAMHILEARDDVAFVITDVNMPGAMDGVGLAHAVHDKWPPIKVLITSGRALRDPQRLPSGCMFLPKPWDRSKITQALHQLAH